MPEQILLCALSQIKIVEKEIRMDMGKNFVNKFYRDKKIRKQHT